MLRGAEGQAFDAPTGPKDAPACPCSQGATWCSTARRGQDPRPRNQGGRMTTCVRRLQIASIRGRDAFGRLQNATSGPSDASGRLQNATCPRREASGRVQNATSGPTRGAQEAREGDLPPQSRLRQAPEADMLHDLRP